MKFIHFDSFRTSNADNIFNNNFPINPQRKVKRIYLKSLEMPIGFYNIRQNEQIRFEVFWGPLPAGNNGSYSFYIDLKKGQYTIQSLISTINSQLSNFYTSNSSYWVGDIIPYISIDPGTQYCRFNVNPLMKFKMLRSGSDISSFYSTDMLGFTSKSSSYFGSVTEAFTSQGTYVKTTTTNNISTSTSYNTLYKVAPYNYNVSNDQIIYMLISNLPHESNTNDNKIVSYKIPIPSSYNQILYNVENLNYGQYIEITDKNYIINNLNIVILDRYMKPLNNNGLDYSFTFGFQYWEEE